MGLGNYLKKIGSILLFLVSFLAYMMTWQMGRLTILGGIIIITVSLVGAILMWRDAEEGLNHPEKQNDGRAKIDQ